MAEPHRFHPTLLREYDIRGIVGDTFREEDARAVGRAFGSIVRRKGGKRVCVGMDGRLSSPMLMRAASEGLRAAGCDVVVIGQGPTPMLYFAAHHLKTDAGLQITGSHNPPEYNGIKLVLKNKPFFGDDIQSIGRLCAAGDVETGAGGEETVDVFAAYIDRLAQDFHGTRKIDVAWDAGNGAAGPAMVALAKRIPGKSTCLYAEVDGRFPNHHPDPTVPENLVELIRTVKEGGYEIGIGFDGDGDRIGVVDGQGRIVWGDQILQVLASDILKRRPGATIIADVKSSQTLFDEIARLGGKPLMYKTGHSLIKAKMAEVDSPLSGEMSGHIFYGDGFYGHDDALYVAVRLLDILARGTRTMADWKDAIPPALNTPETRFDCPEERKFAVVAEVKKMLAASGADVDDIDGVRVKTKDGWWLLRASNTQAALICRAESTTPEGLERLKATVRDVLGKVGLVAPAGF